MDVKSGETTFGINAGKEGLCTTVKTGEMTFGLQAGKQGLCMDVKSGEMTFGIPAGKERVTPNQIADGLNLEFVIKKE